MDKMMLNWLKNLERSLRQGLEMKTGFLKIYTTKSVNGNITYYFKYFYIGNNNNFNQYFYIN